MNIPKLVWFDKRSWTRTPTKYAARSIVGGAAFGGLIALVGLSFFGGWAFAALLVGSHAALAGEPHAWKREVIAGRNGTLNLALSYVSASVPFVVALIAWLVA